MYLDHGIYLMLPLVSEYSQRPKHLRQYLTGCHNYDRHSLPEKSFDTEQQVL